MLGLPLPHTYGHSAKFLDPTQPPTDSGGRWPLGMVGERLVGASWSQYALTLPPLLLLSAPIHLVTQAAVHSN
jgi:hypothetical protein